MIKKAMFVLMAIASCLSVKAQTIDILKNGVSIAKFAAANGVKVVFRNTDYNGHEAVDLGLPSGLKWATCNIGASTVEGLGDYYAWGETEIKENYEWRSYSFVECDGTTSSVTKLLKYNCDSNYPVTDYKAVLDQEDDVAHVKWGGDWRMPTAEDLQELLENCTRTIVEVNGVKGHMFTSKSNGNTIFFPAAGCKVSASAYYVGSDCCYWTSSLRKDNKFDGIVYSQYAVNHAYRYGGCSVRPVCP